MYSVNPFPIITAVLCLAFSHQVGAQQPSLRMRAIAAALKACTAEYRLPVVVDTTTLLKLDGVDGAEILSLKTIMGAGFIWTDTGVPEQCRKAIPKCAGQRVVGYTSDRERAVISIVGFVVNGCGAGGETFTVNLSTFAVLEHKFGGSGSCIPRDSV